MFEREVLRRELTAFNLKDFASFVKMSKTIGFRRVLNARPSKTQKFRHPGFQIIGREVTDDKKGKAKAETWGKGKRNMTEKERDETRRKRQVTGTQSKRFKKNFETPKKTMRRGEVVTEDLRGSTAVKRKRYATELTNKEHHVHIKRQKQNTCTTVSSPVQQRMPRRYCPEEITAAHAMLGLSTPVVLTRNIPLMLAYNLVHSDKAFVLLVERSAGEIEEAKALMKLSHYS